MINGSKNFISSRLTYTHESTSFPKQRLRKFRLFCLFLFSVFTRRFIRQYQRLVDIA